MSEYPTPDQPELGGLWTPEAPELIYASLGGGTGHGLIAGELVHQREIPEALKREIGVVAIIGVADDGGASEKYINHAEVPAPGDATAVLYSMGDNNPLIEALKLRLDTPGDERSALHNMPSGHHLLATLTQQHNGMAGALREMALLVGVDWEKHKAVPVTDSRAELIYVGPDGNEIVGEKRISYEAHIAPDATLRLRQKKRNGAGPDLDVKVSELTEEAIHSADRLIITPGGWNGSILPPLLTKGMPEVIKDARAHSGLELVFIINTTNTERQTEGFGADRYPEEMARHTGIEGFDVIMANDADATREAGYNQDDHRPAPGSGELDRSELVEADREKLGKHAGVVIIDTFLRVIEPDPTKTASGIPQSTLRHDAGRVVEHLFRLEDEAKAA